ncbi:MAG TPA: DUF4349 domain-containing protein [Croceibacterium sp.]|nr:DUF4349 domain-containing protein [Croceibacterium sp.]
MRKALKWLAPLGLLVLPACSMEDDSAVDNGTVGSPAAETAAPAIAAAEDAAVGDAAETVLADGARGPLAGGAEIPVSLPKLAYAFDYGFRLAGKDIAPLQQQHADMCEAQGPYVCRIVSLTRTGEEEDEIHGQLQLAVASDKARGFGALLAASAEAADAEAFRANITGEDLSKSIVDTEARVRSRIALRDRLMEVLETRRGKVEELVEAERQVAAVNEEIDQARSWLNEQQGRVAFSTMTLNYESATPGGSFLKPIEGAVGSLGAIFGGLAALLIVLGSLALPVLAGVFGVRALRRRLKPVVQV